MPLDGAPAEVECESQERCNGVDDDCDGRVDEADGKPAFACVVGPQSIPNECDFRPTALNLRMNRMIIFEPTTLTEVYVELGRSVAVAAAADGE